MQLDSTAINSTEIQPISVHSDEHIIGDGLWKIFMTKLYQVSTNTCVVFFLNFFMSAIPTANC